MAEYPPRGLTPYDLALKAYIDELSAEQVADPDSPLASALDDRVAQAMEDYAPGIRLGYAIRESIFQPTAAAQIPGLSVTVVGKGRPVTIEFYCPGVGHNVPGTYVQAYIIQNGAQIQLGGDVASHATYGPAINPKVDKMLVDGTSYTFTVNTGMTAAGTASWAGAVNWPMTLSVVSR